MKTIIALGGSIESLPILRRARELGHRLVVVDGNEHAPGFELADGRVVSSCYDAQETAGHLRLVLAGYHHANYPDKTKLYDAVLCAATDAPYVAAAVAEAFGLPGLTVGQAALGADKWEQKMKLRQCGITIPRFAAISNLDWVDLVWSDWPNAIIKPRDSRGARGVARLSDGVDRKGVIDQARAQSPTGRVMVEEWLDGPQLSTESLVQDGKVLFTAVGLRNYSRLEEFAPYCIEDGFDSPHDRELGSFGIYDLIERACRALDWYQTGGGVVKGDLVIHNGQLYVIELAPRLSGGLFCAAHELAYGVDFIGMAINMALGYTVEAPRPRPRQFVSQRYIFPSPDDIGKRIKYLSQPPIWDAVFAHYSKPIGHVIAPVTSHADRLGQALCVGATPQEARERAERAVSEMYNGMVVA